MDKLRNKPFALLGIHVGGCDAKKVKEVADRDRLTWRSFVDGGTAGAGPIATQWNLTATPTFYLIDHKGIIRYKWPGPPGEKILNDAIEKLVHAAEEARSGNGR